MPRIQTLILAIVLLGSAGYTGVLLYASVAATRSQADIENWQKSRTVPDKESWQASFERIQSAIRFDPDNPEYLATEAQLYRYRAIMPDTLPSEVLAAYREALEKYQHLLTLRPSWGPYWSSVVSIKYELWQYDDLMTSALQNAARLAPWFKANQHIILQAGFHGWAFLDEETRAVVNKTLRRAMGLQPKETIRLAFEQGFGEWVEPYVEGDDVLMGLYEKEMEKMRQEEKRKEL